jgi:predicted TIM-barrel fold metal-dependent hydrolase
MGVVSGETLEEVRHIGALWELNRHAAAPERFTNAREELYFELQAYHAMTIARIRRICAPSARRVSISWLAMNHPQLPITRRSFLRLAGGAALAAGAGCVSAPDHPSEVSVSEGAQALVREAWRGLDPTRVIDAHVHVIGMGTGGTGCLVHPDTDSLLSPVRYAKALFYKSAAGIHDDERADQLYVERLFSLLEAQSTRGRSLLLAFDKHYTPQGKPDLELTEFYTPNDYVLELAARDKEHLLAAASVHPYRADALDELRRVAEAGAVAIKWLPNAMGIDPLDARCDDYYACCAELGLTILTHTGEEQAVEAEEAQELGNPLRLRRALDAGVTVIAAHMASLGTSSDLDAQPDASGARPLVSGYQLVRRLLDEKRYEGLLFGEISAMTQFNRAGRPLTRTILATPLHARLVNGSDYPLPAINPLVRTGLLVDEGFLDPAEREPINEIYVQNPLLFDFVLKRRLKVDQVGRAVRFSDSVFESLQAFPCLRKSAQAEDPGSAGEEPAPAPGPASKPKGE